MATITTDTFLDGGTARTAGESWTCNGGVLTVRTDTRWHANAPAAMTGSLASITVSSTLGGGVMFDGRNVRWLAYSSGTGNVPAIGTTVSQGGVSGYLLGVWSAIDAAPTAVGAAMPATGFLKFREVTGGPFAAGALTGIGASASGADVTGWIEVVMDQSTTITVSRKGSGSVTRGDWFYLDNTDGTVGQVIKTPSNGGGTGTSSPGIWVETGVGTNQYEFWPALRDSTVGWVRTSMAGPSGATDMRQRFVKSLQGGGLQFGEAFSQNAATYASTSNSSTYTWSANAVTVTRTAHGLLAGEQVYLDFTSGAATADGVYTITSVPNANTYTVALAGSGTGGNVTEISRAVVTYTSHGWSLGTTLYLSVTSGTMPSGVYEATATAANTITVVYAGPPVSGNCNIQATIGHVPEAGRKTRIPNVILRQCATGSRASNAIPNATIANRPDFTTTGAGVVDHEFTFGDWYYSLAQAYTARLHHVATFDSLTISENATAIDMNDGGVGQHAALDARVLTLTSNFAGGTIVDWAFDRGNVPGTADHSLEVSFCSGITFTRCRASIISTPGQAVTGGTLTSATTSP